MTHRHSILTLMVIAFFGLAANAQAEPKNLRAFCSAHKDYAHSGEYDSSNVEVVAAGGNTWRCMGGKVMVCNLGASGAACDRTMRYDAARQQAFKQYCSQFPNQAFIDEATSRGLAGAWRCNGTRPVLVKKTPVDRLGYYVSAWRPLP